jgi:hypothetical protein
MAASLTSTRATWSLATASSSGSGGSQSLLDDPSDNPVELFRPKKADECGS